MSEWLDSLSPAATNRLTALLRGAFGPKALLLPYPHLTGQHLWRQTRDIEGYPLLPDELQERIQHSAGQGRQVVYTPPGTKTIAGLAYYDMRFSYAASLTNLPCGPARYGQGGAFMPYPDGWWHIRFRVPDGWAHIGILGELHPDTGEKWYPDAPGYCGDTWAGSPEIRLALSRGWGVEVIESITFPDTGAYPRPLEVWREKLVTLYAREGGEVQDAIRDITLHTIGAFHRAARQEWVIVPRAERERLPEENTDITRTPEGDFTYQVWAPLRPALLPFTHPEWSALIWSRNKARVLCHERAGRGSGALCVPRRDVIALRGDAVYLARDPDWGAQDDGKPGAMRLKGLLTGPLPAPRTRDDLNALRDKATAAYEKAGARCPD